MSKKETVGTFLGAVMKGDTTTMRELANADYIQHNPFIPTGLEPFIQMLPVLQENGTMLKISECSKMAIMCLCTTFGEMPSLLVPMRWYRLILFDWMIMAK
jgi:hypothetical protein